MTMTKTSTTSTFMPLLSPQSPTASLYYLFTTPLCIIAHSRTATPSPTLSLHIPTLRTLTSPIQTCTLFSTMTPIPPSCTAALTCLRSICIILRTLPSVALPRFTTLALTRPSLRPPLHISPLYIFMASSVHWIRIHPPFLSPRPLPSHQFLRIPYYRPSYSPIPQNSVGLTSRTVPRLNAQSPVLPPR
ncbi:hypothetical protein L210DRAFT_3526988 [Boletus edulis BED1]|uniref:Uncharacterized protein n=1 Tax=Boletus edulis BED1 TaxID=1328754 RepID=A0AAD4C468_BOLED|nr:hypothetical protein L210DRAFT_3526988 [Boletus edulis BED1]